MAEETSHHPSLSKSNYYRTIFAICISIWASNYTVMNMLSFLPEMTLWLGYDDADKGYITGLVSSMYFIGRFISSTTWGWSFGKCRPNVLIMLSLSLSGTFCLVFGFCRSLTTLLVVRFFVGITNGVTPVVRALIFTYIDKEHQAFVLSVMYIAWGMGMSTSPFIGGYLVSPVKQYPSVFGGSVVFLEYPYSLPAIFGFVICISAALIVFLVLPIGDRSGYGILKDESIDDVIVDREDTNNGNNKVKSEDVGKYSLGKIGKYLSDVVLFWKSKKGDNSPEKNGTHPQEPFGISTEGKSKLWILKNGVKFHYYTFSNESDEDEVYSRKQKNTNQTRTLSKINVSSQKQSKEQSLLIDEQSKVVEQDNSQEMDKSRQSDNKIPQSTDKTEQSNNETDKTIHSSETSEESKEWLNNNRNDISYTETDTESSNENETETSALQMMRKPYVYKPILVYTAICFCNFSISDILPVWASSTNESGGLEYTTNQIGNIFALVSLPSLSIVSVFIPIVDKRFGSMSCLRAVILVASFSCAVIPTIRYINNSWGQWFTLVFVEYVFQIAVCAWMVLTNLITNHMVKPHEVAVVSGLMCTAGSIAMATGPAILGHIYSASVWSDIGPPIDASLTFVVCGLITYLAVFVTFTFPREFYVQDKVDTEMGLE